jgi:LytS/YehU family sensor histidine kinase
VPILNDRAVIGVIDSEHPKKQFYTGRQLQVLTTIASLVADKIDKIKAEQQARTKEMELLELNKDLAISQLTALRAQMNPHFIFNALNSVQQYMLQGNVIEAIEYLSRFSKLQREILNHCDQNFIVLEKEIEMLDLYLQLEQLRFTGSFAYTIRLDDHMDPGEIKIPPMILQPFVENAIWHGLMPKQDQRKLEVGFSLTADDILLCTIGDNGIGRQASSRLQQVSANGLQHKSKGLSLVYERLNILRQQYQQPFEVLITDLRDEQDNPQGTLVSLSIFAGH